MSDQYNQPLASAPHSDAPQQYTPQYAQPPPQGYGAPQQPQQYGQPPQQQQQYQPAPYGNQVHVPVYQPNVGPCAAGGGHSIKEEFTACGLVSSKPARSDRCDLRVRPRLQLLI